MRHSYGATVGLHGARHAWQTATASKCWHIYLYSFHSIPLIKINVSDPRVFLFLLPFNARLAPFNYPCASLSFSVMALEHSAGVLFLFINPTGLHMYIKLSNHQVSYNQDST
jgi:hypothetical protein